MSPVLWLACVLVAGCGFGAPDNTYQPPPPPEVTVAQPIQQTVTLFLEENGETEAVEQADVRARVRGFLEEIRFEPGQEVSKDDVLYVIERSEYQAAVNSAGAAVQASKAAVQVAESQVGVTKVEVTRAEIDFERYKLLLEKDAATKSQYDQALAARDSAEATRDAAIAAVVAAKAEQDKAAANLEQAQLDLDYTAVKAPISGRITKTEIKLGNLVDNGSVMATIVDRSRMYANLNMSDRAALQLQKTRLERQKTEGEDARDYRSVAAYLRRELDEGFPFTGNLDYVDEAGVDQATGTLSLRAVFENPDDLILPGLFVRVRLPIGKLEDALLIPEQAVSRDQMGSFVLVLDTDKKVQRRSVTTGQTFDGMTVIADGLGPDDWVLLDGGQRARPGTEVSPVETQLSAPSMAGEGDSEGENAKAKSNSSEVDDPNASDADP